MPVAAAAKLATRLVSRVELRSAPIQPSRPAASTAAGMPCSASSRKITQSPVAIECLLRGMGIGKAAATATSAVQPAICHSSAASRCAMSSAAPTSACTPQAASANQ